MSALQKLETQLNDVVLKKVPFQIPANGRKGLAGALWWLALIGGILQLWGAWALWHLGHLANAVVNYANSLANIYGVPQVAVAPHLGLFFYAAELLLAVTAVIMLLAVSGLKAMSKSGWNWLFYSVLLNALYGVVRVFSGVGGGVGGLIGALIGSAIAAYLIFEVREYFMSKHAAAASAPKAEK